MFFELNYVYADFKLNYIMWFLNQITLCGFGINLCYVVLELHNVETLKLHYVIQYQRSLTMHLGNRPKNLDHLTYY